MIEELTQDNFASKVIDSEIPTVIDFYSKFCVPCRPMSNILEKLSKEYNSSVKFYRLDADKNMELARKLKITDLPTVIFFRNERIGIQRGTAPEDKIRGKIEALMKA